eukprot:3322875-Pyramimonas_sp.AAC.1
MAMLLGLARRGRIITKAAAVMGRKKTRFHQTPSFHVPPPEQQWHLLRGQSGWNQRRRRRRHCRRRPC